MGSKYRRDGQTATAFSLPTELFDAMEAQRKALRMDRSNFIRMALAKELDRLKIADPPGPHYDPTRPKKEKGAS